MQQVTIDKYQKTGTAFNVEKFPLVELTRKFSAPVERLWTAWTTPELIKQWWGPENYSCPDARMDVREGGKSILAMQGPDGKIQYGGGTYLEIVPNQRIVSTDEFMDKDGNLMSAKDAGMPGEWPERSKVTLRFKSLGTNESQLDIIHEGIPQVMHDDCVSGWSSSLDKLQRLVERRT